MEFLLLGPLEVRSQGRSLTLPGRRQRALLALLLLRANEVVSVDALIEGLWGEQPPRTAAHTLQVFVSDVRKALRAAGEDGRIVTQTPGYRIEVRSGELDLERFERLAGEGRAALGAGDAEAAAAALREALALWRGDPLADFAYEPFAQAMVVRLEELRLSVLEDRLAADLRLGKHAELVGELEELASQHPYREQLRAHLMLALYRAGRQSEALAVYQATRTLLVEELGIDPKPELQELERAILVQDPALELLPALPQTPTVPSDPPRLPTAPTPLVGRERELAELEKLLLAQRLVTVSGPGGIGKTRLALAACERLEANFQDGVRFVQLASVTDPGLVPATLALSLAVEERPGEELVDRVARALKGNDLLLCLDNFEQVLEAAPLLADLLSRCARLRLLVTSRSRLRLAGEHEYPLPPLAEDDAVQLFADRARAVTPDFSLNGHEQTVRAICERLDRLPLALELAAARTRLLPPPALLERLAQSLKLLTGGVRDLPERQRTLRAAIDWSYQLLSPDEQRLFRALSVFAGGFDLRAAAAVAESEEFELLEGLGALVEHSLVRRSAEGGEARFFLLETIREYAAERLEASGEGELLRGRHADFVLGLASQFEASFGSAAEHRRFALEQDNFRGALAWAERAGDTGRQLDLVSRGWRFWWYRGHPAEGLRWVESALAPADGERSARRAKVLAAGAMFAFRSGELVKMRNYADESLGLARELNDTPNTTWPLIFLGIWASEAANYDEATRLYEEAAAVARQAGDRALVGIAINNLGVIAQRKRDYVGALPLFEEALAISRELGTPDEIALECLNVADCLHQTGQSNEAAQAAKEGLALARAVENLTSLGDGFVLLGIIACQQGKAELGARLMGAAEELRDLEGQRLENAEAQFLEQATKELVSILGESRYAEAFAEGRKMSLETAVELALTSVD